MCLYWYAEQPISVKFFSEVIDFRSEHIPDKWTAVTVDFLVANEGSQPVTEISAVYPRAFRDPRTLKQVSGDGGWPATATDLSYTLPPFKGSRFSKLNAVYKKHRIHTSKNGRELTISMPHMRRPYSIVPFSGERLRDRNTFGIENEFFTENETQLLALHNITIFRCKLDTPIKQGGQRWFRWHFQVPDAGVSLTDDSKSALLTDTGIEILHYSIMGPYQVPCQIDHVLQSHKTSYVLAHGENERDTSLFTSTREKLLIEAIQKHGPIPTQIENGLITIIPKFGTWLSDLVIHGAAYVGSYGPDTRGTIWPSYTIKTGNELFSKNGQENRVEALAIEGPGPAGADVTDGRFVATFRLNYLKSHPPRKKAVEIDADAEPDVYSLD